MDEMDEVDEVDEVDEADSMRLQSQAASLEPKAQSPKPSLVAALAALCEDAALCDFARSCPTIPAAGTQAAGSAAQRS